MSGGTPPTCSNSFPPVHRPGQVPPRLLRAWSPDLKWGRVDRSETLIRHASPNSSLALPIAALAVAVRLSALVALLIPVVGCTQLLAPDVLPASLTAVPLSTVATGAHREHRPALRGATDSQPENGASLMDRAAHSGIMPQNGPRE
jgi:hypothetical protein